MKAFEKRLASVQASVGSALPVNYVSLLRQGVPEFSQPVGVPFRGELWDVIYLFELGRGHEDQQLDSTCALVSDVLPRYAVPIASDHAGNFFCLFVTGGLLPVSRTPSLGVMMKPEVNHGNAKGIQPRVQA